MVVDILVVEDNEGDVRLIERAFELRDLPGRLHVVQTGDRALDWLGQGPDQGDDPRPDVVLLDLNLPAIDGHDVLEAIREDERLNRLPVAVLTSSQSDDDLATAYDAGANACLRKPVDPEAFMDLVEAFATFWIDAAVLPPLEADEPVDGPIDEPADGPAGG